LQLSTQDLAASKAQEATVLQQLSSEPKSIVWHLATTNEAVKTLTDQLVQDEIQRQRLTQPGGFTAQAPQIVALDAEIAGLRKRIASTPSVVTSVSSTANETRVALEGQFTKAQTDYETSKAKIATLKQEIKDLDTRLALLTKLMTPYDRLERQHDEAAKADTMFTDKITDLDLRLKAHHDSVHVIEPATVPSQPVYPNRPLIAIFGVLIGLFLGVLAALGTEMFDDRLNSPAEGERALHLPALGRIPLYTSDDLQMLAKMTGRRPELESYKTLRTNLYFCSVDLPVKSLLVTSAAPQEGKTTTAVNLAFVVAADNKDVILIDTDLRRPSVHKVLGIPAKPGLTDLLLGTATLDEVMLHIPGVPGLRVITAGTIPPNPSELLNSQKFKMLIDELTHRVDLVICDSAPVLAVADSQIVSNIMDATLLVVANGQTKKAAANQARHLLLRARANLVGIAYNMASTNDPGYYYYEYSSQPEQIEGTQNGHLPALTTTKVPPK
jgi:capsular exopolysaccharide synthesis family protein